MREFITASMPKALEELAQLVAFRSVADPQVEDPAQCLAAAQWVRDALIAEGLDDAALVTTPDGTDAVIAHYDGPAGAPRVLLYAHYDVQPAPPEGWNTDPFTLTKVGERYYGRGAADCKGGVMAHLLTLRALQNQAQGQHRYPVSLTVIVEGSEEQGTGGLEDYVALHPEAVAADVIIIGDSGNAAVGVPTLTVSLRGVADVTVRVKALEQQVHSGAFGGPAPDALAALVAMLATLRDEHGNTTIKGLPADQVWEGLQYDQAQYRRDVGALEGTQILGTGSIADSLWARPVANIIGIDAPPVVGAVPVVIAEAAAKINLRVPPGTDALAAQDALVAHLQDVAPWGVQVEVERVGLGQPFLARQDTQAFQLLSDAMAEAFGAATVTSGQGGAIPLTAALAKAHPDASIVMIGVSEPESRMHGANESVHPDEIAHMALAQALFITWLGDLVQGHHPGQ